MTLSLQVAAAAPTNGPDVDAAPGRECFTPDDQWSGVIEPLFRYLIENTLGLAPWIASAVLAVAFAALIATLRSENAPRWLKVIVVVIFAVIGISFAPVLVFTISSGVPACAG